MRSKGTGPAETEPAREATMPPQGTSLLQGTSLPNLEQGQGAPGAEGGREDQEWRITLCPPQGDTPRLPEEEEEGSGNATKEPSEQEQRDHPQLRGSGIRRAVCLQLDGEKCLQSHRSLRPKMTSAQKNKSIKGGGGEITLMGGETGMCQKAELTCNSRESRDELKTD